MLSFCQISFINTAFHNVLFQNVSVDESENVIETRYVGALNRDIATFDNGPLDFTGNLEFFPQDWRFLYLAMGSVADAGSPSPYTHAIVPVNSNSQNGITSGTKNPFVSFTLDVSQNSAGSAFRRFFNGCVVENFTLTASEGENLSCSVDWLAQSRTFTETAGSSVTASTDQVYQWSDVQLHVPSGTVIQNLKSVSFSLTNGFLPPHYLNGSRVIDVPQAQNREYELSVTKNSEDQSTRTFYDSYFLGGSTFNAMLQVTASAGSQELFLVMSGCRLLDMDAPTGNQSEPNEQTITIRPQSCNANVNDLVFKYAAF